MGRLFEEYGKVTAAYLKPIERGQAKTGQADEASDMVKTLGRVAERWTKDPGKIIEAQASLTGEFFNLWSASLKRASGEEVAPIAEPDKRDSRFKDPDWSNHPTFDFIKQAYLIGSRWAETMVEKADDLDPHTREKARFYIKQIASALSPTNFIATNPELRPLFKNDMDAQAHKFIEMLAIIVGLLSNPTALSGTLTQLAHRHRGYGVRDEHFDMVRDALLGTLGDILGDAFTPELRNAWRDLYGLVASAMKRSSPSHVNV